MMEVIILPGVVPYLALLSILAITPRDPGNSRT
jgi:hypothetical protein